MAWLPHERPNKDLARRLFFQNAVERRVSIHLPGKDCECLKAGLEAGAFGPASFVTLVERDPAIWPHIERFVAREWPGGWATPRLHRGDFSTLELREPVDSAFIDLLGNLTRRDCLQLMQMDFAPNAAVGFTFNFCPRGNAFIGNCLRAMSGGLSAKLAEKCRRLDNFPQEMKSFLAMYMVMFEDVLFTNYRFTLSANYYKEDGTANTMFLFRLGKMTKQPWPAAPDRNAVDHFFGEPVMASKLRLYDPKVRHEAAVKAAATRRANVLAAEAEAERKAQVRHMAAVKAWATRRANAAA